jgi:hypothetical protein
MCCGTAVVIALYLLVKFAPLRTLPLTLLSTSPLPVAAAAQVAFGPIAGELGPS